MSSFLLSRAGSRTLSLVLIQALLNYVRFLATDKPTTVECLVKTFLIAPLLIFAIQYSLEEVLWRLNCEHSLQKSKGVILTSGLMKSIVFTWSNLSVAQFLEGKQAMKIASVIVTLLVMFGVFCLTGYAETLYLRGYQMNRPTSLKF